MPQLSREEVEQLLLDCCTQLNQMRAEGERLEISPTATLFGEGSPLDSLGLVTLIFDVEEALSSKGVEVNLSDARAMSRARSPYRSVASMTDLILELSAEQGT